MKRPQEDEDYWMQSFADLVSLLLGFFVVMLSMSATDSGKYQALADSMEQMITGQPQSPTQSELAHAELAETARRYIAEQGLDGQVSVRRIGPELELTAAGSLLFHSASAELSPEAERLLDEIASLLVARGLSATIEGHTDDIPIHSSQYPTNWELSAARATAVVRFLIRRGVPATRLVAQGYADTRPLESPQQASDIARARAKNRRVVLLMGLPSSAKNSSVAL